MTSLAERAKLGAKNVPLSLNIYVIDSGYYYLAQQISNPPSRADKKNNITKRHRCLRYATHEPSPHLRFQWQHED